MKRILALASLALPALNAQCVMCFRTAAAQQMERARVLNFGIVIMLIPPVVILGGFLFLCWRRNTAYADGVVQPREEIVPSETTSALVGK